MFISVKKLSKISLITAILITLFIIAGNFYFLPRVERFISEHTEKNLSMTLNYKDVGYKASVLNNIISAYERNNVISDVMENAYKRNLSEYEDLIETLREEIVDLKERTTSIYKYSFSKRKAVLRKIDDGYKSLLEYVDLIDIARLETYDGVHIGQIIQAHADNLDYVEDLHEQEKEISDDISKNINLVVNGLLIILMFQLFLYVYITNHLANHKLGLLIKAIKMISKKTYDDTIYMNQKIRFKEDIEIQEAIKRVYDDGNFTEKLVRTLEEYYEVDEIVTSLFQLLQPRLEIDRIGIAFVDYQYKQIIAEYGVLSGGNIKLGPGFEVDFHETSLYNIIEKKKTIISKNLAEQFKRNPSSKPLQLLMEEGIQSNMIIPVLINGNVLGFVFFSSRKKNHFTKEDKVFGESVVSSVSSLLVRSYFTKIVLSKVTNSFSRLVEQKDNETGEHLDRMTQYSLIIANGLRKRQMAGYEINDKFLLELERNAAAHDIGKVGIPDNILKKPGKLDAEEWEIMKTHTDIGADIFNELREELHLFGNDFFLFPELIARYHHEKWDGSGYPKGLSGDKIPLVARIVAMGDVFDALTSKRSYKSAFAFEESVDIIKEGKGKHFDPVLVDIFLEEIDEIQALYQKSREQLINEGKGE